MTRKLIFVSLLASVILLADLPMPVPGCSHIPSQCPGFVDPFAGYNWGVWFSAVWNTIFRSF